MLKNVSKNLIEVDGLNSEENIELNIVDNLNKDKRVEISKMSIKTDNRNRNEIDNLRATLLLIAVCTLFFIAEFPQAILLFISIFNQEFYFNVYKPLGDLMDILVLINYSISFLLYCIMSREFRNNFVLCVSKLVCGKNNQKTNK